MTDAQLKAIGYGESRQVVAGAERDDTGAELNRRVVFVVETKGDSTATNMTASAISTSRSAPGRRSSNA